MISCYSFFCSPLSPLFLVSFHYVSIFFNQISCTLVYRSTNKSRLFGLRLPLDLSLHVNSYFCFFYDIVSRNICSILTRGIMLSPSDFFVNQTFFHNVQSKFAIRNQVAKRQNQHLSIDS